MTCSERVGDPIAHPLARVRGTGNGLVAYGRADGPGRG